MSSQLYIKNIEEKFEKEQKERQRIEMEMKLLKEQSDKMSSILSTYLFDPKLKMKIQ
jgi:hypothetical protein